MAKKKRDTQSTKSTDLNAFRENGWAMKVLANAQDNTISGNVFDHCTRAGLGDSAVRR